MILDERRVVFVRRIMLWASLAGLFVSTYLLITYVTNGPIVCGVAKGCDIVRNSEWATSFGVPRPLLGVVFYVAIIALLVWRAAYPHTRVRAVYRLSMIAVTIGFIESAFLTFVQAVDIKAYCVWCLTSAVMATILFVAAWWDRSRAFEDRTALRELAIQFWSLMAAVIVGGVLILVLTVPWTDGERPRLEPSQIGAAEDERVRSLLERPDVTFEGPATATVTLIEFIDYQCPACKLAHSEILKVRDRYKGRIRFAFRNFPLPVHKAAVGAALGAVCADKQGKLFAYADVLIANQNALAPADLIRYASSLQFDTAAFKACLTDPSTKALVERDLSDGRELGVNATPTFFVGTTMIEGLPSAEQMGQLIEEALP
ncbi:MAG TPA: vitamin K epoxide reductase family protein [Candidatus Methylomirabilis sp.]|nr:vitamin K epoxide reductase family protein [Candidatus Methylomirabilis sp.]